MIKQLGFKLLTYLTLAALFVTAIYFALAVEVPMGAQGIIEGQDSTINLSNYFPMSHEAFAGNITELNISGRSQTKHWQGYYGEITGTIVLDDAQNWTMYDWPSPEPKGEVYATVNYTVDWQSISCFNYTAGAGTEDTPLGNLSYWEVFYNFTYNDVDGIDETFNLTNHIIFDVGDVTINSGTCHNTYTHVSDNFQEDKFVEVLLQDNLGTLVFSTIIENDDNANNTDVIGYNDVTHDFQMLVAEDGTSRTGPGGSRNLDTTTYYFFLDLQ
jgi:hypothetical protein